jgi:hypothetical protein
MEAARRRSMAAKPSNQSRIAQEREELPMCRQALRMSDHLEPAREATVTLEENMTTEHATIH